MRGNIDSIDIDIKKLILKSKYSQGVGENIVIKEYRITLSDIDALQEMIKKYNFVAWDDLEYDFNRVPLDASTPSLTFKYDNSNIGGSTFDSYNINFYNKIPADGYDLLYEFVKYMYSLEKEENLINTYEEEW